ncbi:hypothetical protein ACHAXN_013072 [Cyclotella atomus]
MAESDIYRMGPADFDPSDESSDEEMIHELPNDSGDDLIDFQQTKAMPQVAPTRRPPNIATEWDNSMDRGIEIDGMNVHHDRVYPIQSLNKSRFTQTPATKADISTPSTEETPAFIRQYARDIMKIADNNLATSPRHSIIPPTSLLGVREKSNPNYASSNTMSSNNNSFVGADASGLDATFVSIRDLNEDDDVPSINNETPYAKYDGTFPTERTSLLGNMPWRGGFFPQVEKEDRKERRKMVRSNKGWISGWVWSMSSILSDAWDSTETRDRRVVWDASHPIGAEIPVRSYVQGSRRPLFAMVLTGVLCFHMMLCALHDLFVRYVSYRNEEDVGVSWDGEGTYSPPYWFSFEGRVLNPLIGPGSRTLTAFGALVPGLLLSKGQWWRILLSILESSSPIEMLLHFFVLKTAIGGSMVGLETRRGAFAVTLFYIISASIGSAWSMAVDKGRLVTSSGMGVTGLLAAAIVEQYWFPSPVKAEDGPSHSIHNDLGGNHNVVSSSSNEQFTFQPMPSKKERKLPIKVTNPLPLLAIEILVSWWAPYQSLSGTITAASMGVALALAIFVGKSPDSPELDNKDLLFHETPPPPPASMPGMYRDDDDSADSSFGSGREPFNTPLMRKSIFGDDEEDEHGPKSLLRKRKSHESETKSTPARYISIHSNKTYHSSVPILWKITGIFMALLLTLIPAALIAAGEDPSQETIRASVLGCKPMRIVYRKDDNSDAFQCAGGCVPLSRTKVAQKKEGMHDGRCDTIGFRCLDDGGTMILRQFELDVGLYSVPTSDGTCASSDNDDAAAAAAAAQPEAAANENNEAA